MWSKRSAIVGHAFTSLCLTFGTRVGAEEPSADPHSGDFFSRSTMTGDWGGARNDLAAKGVTFDANLTQIEQGVVSGGKNGAWEYGGVATSPFISIPKSSACGREDF